MVEEVVVDKKVKWKVLLRMYDGKFEWKGINNITKLQREEEGNEVASKNHQEQKEEEGSKPSK